MKGFPIGWSVASSLGGRWVILVNGIYLKFYPLAVKKYEVLITKNPKDYMGGAFIKLCLLNI
jgi:hypothetical protein